MLVLLDFLHGPRGMAWRILDMLFADESTTRPRDHDDEVAVLHSIVGILHMLLGGFINAGVASAT